jgi:hypothetical protein
VPKLHELLGLSIREGPQEDGIHDAERGGGAGDAKPERENRDGRKPGRAG